MYSFPFARDDETQIQLHKSPADEEPDTDVGAPIDCPGDVAVLQPNGSTYRPAANDSEAAELLEAAGWIDWDAAAGVGPA